MTSLIDIISYLKTYNKTIQEEWMNYIKLNNYYKKFFLPTLGRDLCKKFNET